MLDANFGADYVPTREALDEMVDRCYMEVEPSVYGLMRRDFQKIKTQQFFDNDAQDLLRAFITAAIITSLINRRRFGFGFTPFFGFGSPFFGF